MWIAKPDLNNCLYKSVTCENKWRRGWDSNPRWSCPHAAFRVRYFRPLSHLSASLVGATSVRGRFHNRQEPLAQGVSLRVRSGNCQFGLTPWPVSRISRPDAAWGFLRRWPFVGYSDFRTSRRLHPAHPATEMADPIRLAKRRPAARREPDEHERTKDVRSH